MLKLKGSGHYLPKRIVTSLELDEKCGLAAGTFEKTSGVKSRHYASEEESSSMMGAMAARAALEDAGLKFSDIDLILGACGTPEQAIPCTAALIQAAMGQEDSGVPCFDVNSTCLSFMTAFQVAASFIETKQYNNILIVSSEIASVGLNYKTLESASLFGDGAAAVVVGRAEAGQTPTRILGYHMATYSSGRDTCEIVAGGSRAHPSKLDWRLHDNDERFLFKMDGPKIFKMASKMLPRLVRELESKSGVSLEKAKLVIPHQASESAVALITRKLDIAPEKMYKIIAEHGNMIAASIPLCLHYALSKEQLRDGDVTYMLGTSAGFSMAGMVLQI